MSQDSVLNTSNDSVNVTIRHHDGRNYLWARNAVTRVGRGPEGSDDSFHARELLLGALGTCTAGTVRAFAAKHGIVGFEELEVEVIGEEEPSPVRIARIEVRLHVRGSLSSADLLELRRAAQNCKIHNTLAPAIDIRIKVTQESANQAVRAAA